MKTYGLGLPLGYARPTTARPCRICAVGGRLFLDGDPYEVVGVVGDHFERNLADPIRPAVYLPIRRFTGRARS